MSVDVLITQRIMNSRFLVIIFLECRQSEWRSIFFLVFRELNSKRGLGGHSYVRR